MPRTALSRTDPLEAKAKDQGHRRQVFSKKKKGLQKFFSGNLQSFDDSKDSAVLEPKTGEFPRFEATRPRPKT